ncbi:MAG: arsenate reductase (glutaredoxin) [Flavobacteriales bacterium]|jgi:arsenate reductase|nr:arsenate reductase (glutaredoxin) [Flavobacteriales bacterium]NCG29967.1 arsenate reductase (glutaredoxin) [Bacteroidota bacterium]MBT3964819.1 arsenate reductase (glutaredoxin) [Flavobacteriales bacterium]MBT4704034.1 arsenate reductase (glutaredoxin) [Flavobacteriales bacterium]MBT4930270.1 arsenate reductase (glutaredoxin) [Flavobacteriales bacterium]
MKIYHNPRCRKSRETLTLILDNGKAPEIVEYLKSPPSADELRAIIDLLGISAQDLIRKGEDIFKTEYKGKELSDAEWIDAMIQNPKLIQRPIVVENGKAVLGRPPENVLDLL